MNEEKEIMDKVWSAVYEYYESEHSMAWSRYLHPMFRNDSMGNISINRPPLSEPGELLTKEEFIKGVDDGALPEYESACHVLFRYIRIKKEIQSPGILD